MTPFHKQWLAALRSGRYKQAKSRLCSSKGYCCLGVAAKEYGLLLRNDEFVYGQDIMVYSLYADFLKEIALDFEVAVFVANANDEGKTFFEIADYLEKVL
jgi:hypothetical protein